VKVEETAFSFPDKIITVSLHPNYGVQSLMANTHKVLFLINIE